MTIAPPEKYRGIQFRDLYLYKNDYEKERMLAQINALLSQRVFVTSTGSAFAIGLPSNNNVGVTYYSKYYDRRVVAAQYLPGQDSVELEGKTSWGLFGKIAMDGYACYHLAAFTELDGKIPFDYWLPEKIEPAWLLIRENDVLLISHSGEVELDIVPKPGADSTENYRIIQDNVSLYENEMPYIIMGYAKESYAQDEDELYPSIANESAKVLCQGITISTDNFQIVSAILVDGNMELIKAILASLSTNNDTWLTISRPGLKDYHTKGAKIGYKKKYFGNLTKNGIDLKVMFIVHPDIVSSTGEHIYMMDDPGGDPAKMHQAIVNRLNLFSKLGYLDQWGEYLWNVGKKRELIKRNVVLGDIPATYLVSTNEDAWTKVIKDGLHNKEITIG